MTPSIFDTKLDITVEQHHRAVAAKMISLIRKLEKDLGVERAHDIISNWAEQNVIHDVRGVIDNLNESIDSFEEVKKLLRQWVKELNDNKMEVVEITEETSTKSVCTVTECIYAKVYNDLGAPDLGYLLYCKHDFASAPHIHPKVGLNRTKTVMEGHECCNFEYYWST
ncbi:MAG: L-2-amino-thiazoline-4-carboxylic acid hydrolase [Candidatus Thorarchaeota archaeon]